MKCKSLEIRQFPGPFVDTKSGHVSCVSSGNMSCNDHRSLASTSSLASPSRLQVTKLSVTLLYKEVTQQRLPVWPATRSPLPPSNWGRTFILPTLRQTQLCHPQSWKNEAGAETQQLTSGQNTGLCPCVTKLWGLWLSQQNSASANRYKR
jgi:hypothetical protein